ncbi:hypothetical protein [Paraburkholderia dilworthii]|nr:hypothetical protein [Paraburkholderia dilworthii]
MLTDAFDAHEPIRQVEIFCSAARAAINEIPDHRFEMRYFSIGQCCGPL